MGVHLISGDDPVLVSEAVSKLVDRLVGERDRALTLATFQEEDMRLPEEGWSPAALIDAARTPPFLSDKRVVVGRHLARFSRAELYKPLMDLAGEPMPTTDLVLVWERGQDPAMTGRVGTVPKALKDAVTAAGGEVLNVNAPTRKRDAGVWLREQIKQSGLRFDAEASRALADLAGQDGGLVVGTLRTLTGALGSGAKVTAEDVATYGGEPGSVAPWDLDDAIDNGDIAKALDVLHRQMPARHPFQILASLHGRYQRMLRLDGSGATDEKQAAQVLQMSGSTFPARKALSQARKLGSDRVVRAIRLLAEADLAMRGTLAWSPEMVMDVLVARLAALSR